MTKDNDSTFQDLASALREIERLKAENARLEVALNLSLDGNRPLALSRDELGAKVREVRSRWAECLHIYLTPWSQLDETDREMDRVVGEQVARWVIAVDATTRSDSTPMERKA